jgi:Domain of unknown function (DUF4432)
MATINLNAVQFDRTETLVLKTECFEVWAFRYASGAAALRIKNTVGEIVFLPFHGQQIWDAQFYGRRLTMRSMFDEPVNTRNYLENYGAFLLHCGATAMGNQGAGDTHPLHGELPNAPYQEAELTIQGDFLELSGHYRHTVAFAHNYVAEPRLRMFANHGQLELDLGIRNLKRDAMELMYLAHVNFRPVDQAEIIDTVPNDPKYFRIRSQVPEFFKPTQTHRDLIAALQTQPALHRKLELGRAIDPELVMGLTFKQDKNGWAHSMQSLPDGTADFISHRPEELAHGVRWITRTANQDALGLFLPGTAEADGYTAEKAKGNLVIVAAGETWNCHLKFGALTQEEALTLKHACKSVVL